MSIAIICFPPSPLRKSGPDVRRTRFHYLAWRSRCPLSTRCFVSVPIDTSCFFRRPISEDGCWFHVAMSHRRKGWPIWICAIGPNMFLCNREKKIVDATCNQSNWSTFISRTFGFTFQVSSSVGEIPKYTAIFVHPFRTNSSQMVEKKGTALLFCQQIAQVSWRF